MPGELLSGYLRRLRLELGLAQKKVADKAGIHLKSLGKLERGKTRRLNCRTKVGLDYALGGTQRVERVLHRESG